MASSTDRVVPAEGRSRPLRAAAARSPRQRGRPRDEALHDRVLHAAIDVYAEHGWRGFNFETVATAAAVGRPALYRRWPDSKALLVDAILATTPEVVDEDLGSLSAELARLLTDYEHVMRGSRGRAGPRLYLDESAIPDVVAAVHERLMGRRLGALTAAVRRAAARAGRPSAVPDRLLFAFLIGGALAWRAGAPGRPGASDADALDVPAVVTALVSLTGLPT
jgi:AcrR family transcriptional regulator